MDKIVHRISVDSRRRFFLGVCLAAVTFLLLRGRVSHTAALVASWDVFALCVLALAWFTIVLTPQRELPAHAKMQDLSRMLISIFAVGAACVALFAVAFLIRAHHAEMQRTLTWYVIFALGTVSLSWALLNTIFCLHYAHVFYEDTKQPGERSAVCLQFPEGAPLPDYLDFAYFAFVIGMTCQVSDVQVTSRRMRRLTLLHGVLSFGYNTVILALLINTVSGLL